MAASARYFFEAARPFDEVGRHIATRIRDLLFQTVHVDTFRDESGARRLIVFGFTPPMRGSTLASLWFQGVRYVPFFLEVKEAGERSHVIVAAAGAETWTGFDFGRNKGVAGMILEGLPGELLPDPGPPRSAEPDRPVWRDSAPGL